jgi:SAM-dependent methyltransferase
MSSDFGSFVLERVPPSARILEVGCGSGDLARMLATTGYTVTAIDPDAPEGQLFRQLTLEEFAEPGPFDAVVASRSLHHVPDLAVAIGKIASLLTRGGLIVLDDYAKERFDLRTAAWYFRHRETIAACGGPDAHDSLDECVHEWEADDAHIHGYREMRRELDERFLEQAFVWVPYLYRDLEGAASMADEQAAIDAGTIEATGFRYVGETKST